MKGYSADLPPWAWALIALILLGQAAWIYRDAQARGERKFLWGLFGLLNFPSSVLVYLIVTRVLARKTECPSCHERIPAGSRFCPACGAKTQGPEPSQDS